MEVPQNGWFIVDLGVPPVQETSMSLSIEATVRPPHALFARPDLCAWKTFFSGGCPHISIPVIDSNCEYSIYNWV